MTAGARRIAELVTGPHPLPGRKLSLYEGERALILRHGRAWGVRDPGRSGGIVRRMGSVMGLSENDLPTTGELSYLSFSVAPVLEVLRVEVQLEDGARVQIEADVSAEPSWSDDTSSLLKVGRRYGVSVGSLVAEMESALLGDFQMLVREAVRNYGHDQLHDILDPRMLFGRETSGFLNIVRITNVRISRDAVTEAAVAATREADIETARIQSEIQLEGLRGALSGIQQAARLVLARSEALSAAQLHAEVAQVFGVTPWEQAHPELVSAERSQQREILGSLLTDNADMLVLLAQGAGGFDEVLRSASETLSSTGRISPISQTPSLEGGERIGVGLPAPTRWQMNDLGRQSLTRLNLAPEEEVRGAFAVTRPGSASETFLVAVVGPKSSHPLGVHRVAAPGGGELFALLVADQDNKISAVLDLMGLFQRVASVNLHLGVADHVTPDGAPVVGAGTISIKDVTSTPETSLDSERRLGALLTAVSGLVEATHPTVDLQI